MTEVKDDPPLFIFEEVVVCVCVFEFAFPYICYYAANSLETLLTRAQLSLNLLLLRCYFKTTPGFTKQVFCQLWKVCLEIFKGLQQLNLHPLFRSSYLMPLSDWRVMTVSKNPDTYFRLPGFQGTYWEFDFAKSKYFFLVRYNSAKPPPPLFTQGNISEVIQN